MWISLSLSMPTACYIESRLSSFSVYTTQAFKALFRFRACTAPGFPGALELVLGLQGPRVLWNSRSYRVSGISKACKAFRTFGVSNALGTSEVCWDLGGSTGLKY